MLRRLVLVVALFATVFGVGTAAAARPAFVPATPIASPSADVARVLNAVPPDGQVTVIVRLRSKATLAGARHGTRAQRQRAAIDDLRHTADLAQGQLRAYLDAGRQQRRVASYTPFWVFDGMSVTATPAVIAELAKRPDVESITPDAVDIVPTDAPTAPAEPNIAKVNAPALWSQGYYGQGVVVANLDSGVDVTHPDLAPSYRGGSNSWFDPYGQHATPTDLSGHGTETMGVMVGGQTGGTTIGVAPGATWIAGRVFNDAGTATATAIHSALQWVLDPDGNPATADAPAVVNNSWAYGNPGCNLEFQPDLQALRAAGIVPVFADGNSGPAGSTSVSPANYPEALSVGATNANDTIYAFSSRGPAACGEPSGTYPDLVAPGVNIYTTERFGMYSVATGTSLAAPHVAGAIALLMSTGLASATTAEQALLATATDLGVAGADNVFGRGRIDTAAALGFVARHATAPTDHHDDCADHDDDDGRRRRRRHTTIHDHRAADDIDTTTTTEPTTTIVPSTTTTSTTVPPPTSTTTTNARQFRRHRRRQQPRRFRRPSTTTTTLPPATTTTTTIPNPPSDQLFADGFESGSTSAWSSSVTNGGRLTVTTSATLAGSYGLRANIVNRNDMYVADTTPTAERSYHARFRFDPNTVSIGSGKIHDMFVATNASGATNLRVQVTSASNAYMVRTGTLLNSGSIKYSAWTHITDAPHSIEVAWQAATSGSNGSTILYVDGSLVASATGLANSAARIDSARLGPQSVGSPASPVSSTSTGSCRRARVTSVRRCDPRMRRCCAALVGAVVVFLIAPVSQVAAHASFLGSNPVDGSVLVESPLAAELRFSDEVLASASHVELLQLGSGRSEVLSISTPHDGHTLVAQLPALDKGAYVVRFDVVDPADLHKTVGSVSFGVGVAAPPSISGAQLAGSWMLVVVRALTDGALLLCAGATVLLLLIQRSGKGRPDGAGRLAVRAAWVTAVGWIALLVADAAAVGFERVRWSSLIISSDPGRRALIGLQLAVGMWWTVGLLRRSTEQRVAAIRRRHRRAHRRRARRCRGIRRSRRNWWCVRRWCGACEPCTSHRCALWIGVVAATWLVARRDL